MRSDGENRERGRGDPAAQSQEVVMTATTQDATAILNQIDALPDPGPQPDRVTGRPVREVMATPILAVSLGTALGDVLQAMLRMDRRHVVVIDHEGHCVGILGDRAVAAAWAHDPSALSRRQAGQFLETRASVVAPQATVREVAAVMIRDDVDAVAVVNPAGEPIGIVTGSDLVALMAGTGVV
jgi:CBS domain-containing protein